MNWTWRRAAPGTPLADAIFNLCWLAVLRRVHHRLQFEGISTALTCKGGGIFEADAEDVDCGHPMEVEAPDTTYVDDEALLLDAEDADMLMHVLCRASVVLRDEAAASGFQLNWEAGKTEAVLSWQGRGAQNVRKALPETQDGARLLAIEPGVNLRRVKS